jgi:predicted nucleotidyltransferase component of viral defense system
MVFSAKVTALLGKDGNLQQCDRMSTLLDRMVQIDQEVDKDRRAVDETWRQHGTDVSEKPILRQHYNKMYIHAC